MESSFRLFRRKEKDIAESLKMAESAKTDLEKLKMSLKKYLMRQKRR